MEHTISVLVENHFGVLAKISGLFSARGFNIMSLSVGTTDDPETSRMTIVVDADDKILEQVKKQLNKLIDTKKVIDLTGTPSVERELILVKVRKEARISEIMEMVDVFRGKIIDVSVDSVTVELTGSTPKIDAFIELVRPFGILETARTGRVALGRGEKTLRQGL
jgi:acetolactate synthase-1/3 small subunit